MGLTGLVLAGAVALSTLSGCPRNDPWKTFIEAAKASDYFFTANYSEKGNSGDIKDKEIEGLGKKIFKLDEKVSFGCRIKDKAGRNVKFKLIGPNEETLEEKESKVENDNYVIMYTYLPGQLKEGEQRVIWTVEGALYGEAKDSVKVYK